MDKASNPHDTVRALVSSISEWLLHPHSVKERYRMVLLPPLLSDCIINSAPVR